MVAFVFSTHPLHVSRVFYLSIPFLSEMSPKAGLYSLSLLPCLSVTSHAAAWPGPPLESSHACPDAKCHGHASPQLRGPVLPLHEASFLGLLDPLPWRSLVSLTSPPPFPRGHMGFLGSELPASSALCRLPGRILSGVRRPLSTPPHTSLVQLSPGLSPEHGVGPVGDTSS